MMKGSDVCFEFCVFVIQSKKITKFRFFVGVILGHNPMMPIQRRSFRPEDARALVGILAWTFFAEPVVSQSSSTFFSTTLSAVSPAQTPASDCSSNLECSQRKNAVQPLCINAQCTSYSGNASQLAGSYCTTDQECSTNWGPLLGNSSAPPSPANLKCVNVSGAELHCRNVAPTNVDPAIPSVTASLPTFTLISSADSNDATVSGLTVAIAVVSSLVLLCLIFQLVSCVRRRKRRFREAEEHANYIASLQDMAMTSLEGGQYTPELNYNPEDHIHTEMYAAAFPILPAYPGTPRPSAPPSRAQTPSGLTVTTTPQNHPPLPAMNRQTSPAEEPAQEHHYSNCEDSNVVELPPIGSTSNQEAPLGSTSSREGILNAVAEGVRPVSVVPDVMPPPPTYEVAVMTPVQGGVMGISVDDILDSALTLTTVGTPTGFGERVGQGFVSSPTDAFVNRRSSLVVSNRGSIRQTFRLSSISSINELPTEQLTR
ncbi:hypothetical protein BJ742DRAFT_162027 [Cladochytrium replicatum]|nr:hypothetical protein BJ742DRAFT_162027 [Cladochytrium replicatum]